MQSQWYKFDMKVLYHFIGVLVKTNLRVSFFVFDFCIVERDRKDERKRVSMDYHNCSDNFSSKMHWKHKGIAIKVSETIALNTLLCIYKTTPKYTDGELKYIEITMNRLASYFF